uniref:Putative Saposin B domain-containing protein isoform 1 n=1 Tax=Davidia involucrata TaxID=16924 RepID=A0A5B6YZT6_DAVIN
MGVRVGLLLLFVLGTSWACDARELMTSDFSSGKTVISDVSVLQINDKELERKVGRNENVCTLCEEFTAKTLKYFAENKTQTEIIGILQKTCSRMSSFKEQCNTLVDYYAPLFFLEIASVQARDFCRKVNLFDQMAITSPLLFLDSCGIYHFAVEKVLLKLKNPKTQLEIIELLLKRCDAVESYMKKCKPLVFEYGPLILTNVEMFLETTDICTMLHASRRLPISIAWSSVKFGARQWVSNMGQRSLPMIYGRFFTAVICLLLVSSHHPW